ncbi:MAG: epoxyqueuosine reductase [Desulfotignum sp.]|nr:epoxyqueuosine reductase [Desulfotignum sp.]
MTNALKVSSAILQKAKDLGASLVGIARVEDLISAPSFTFAPKMPHAGEGIGTRKSESGLKPGEVAWPDNARSMVVIAVLHPEDEPEMDWWFGRKDPPGNRVLANICRELCPWIEERFGIQTVHLPYHVEKGGTYLKDAAVMAGLGCIGKNNILVTPEYGPRVRLRAVTVDADLFATGPRQFDPCRDCMEFCRRVCPQKAFDKRQYTVEAYGQPILPGRDGHYSRPICNVQMEQDNDMATEQPVKGVDNPVKIIKYCRRCELACPVGKPFKTPDSH